MPDSASISTLSGTSDRLQERLERQIWFNSEAIIETTRIVVLEVVFIQRPGKFAADLPDKRLEAILQAIFFISHSTRISCGSAWKFDQISWWNGITTFAFMDTAFAISTDCIWAIESVPSFAFGS